MKLVTRFLNEAARGGHYFGVTFQQEFVGLSTYTFPDGSVTASFAGESYEPGRDRGTYVILNGTGKYKGAKGTGSFDGVGAEANAVKGTGVDDNVTLNINLRTQ